MTFKQQYKVMVAVMVMLAHALITNAQDDEKRNTGESLGKQYLNNRAPGLQYGPQKSKALRRATKAEQEENHNESSGMQLKKGTIKGMRFAPGSTGNVNTARRTTAKRSATAGGTLSSDQKAVEIKPEVTKPITVPTQNGATEPEQKEIKKATLKAAAPAQGGIKVKEEIKTTAPKAARQP